MATEGGFLSRLSSIWKSEESGGASALWTEKSNLKFKLILSGKTLNSHEDFITRLNQQVHLKEVNTEDESDFILGFCPIVTRAGTDIEAAMKSLHDISDTKPVVLVVLHHTYDPECVVPDSIKCVNRKNMIAVDCLFHEDKGLLQCLKNNESLDKTSQYLKKELHVKLKKQGQELRKRTRVNEEKDEERNDTDMKPKKMIMSNETQERKYTLHERNQIFEEFVKRREMKKKLTEKDEEGLVCLKDMIIVLEKQKTELEGKNRDLLKKLEDKETQLVSVVKELETSTNTLTERDKQIQEKDKTIKELEDSKQHVEEKNTQIEKLLKEKETQLKNTDKELETSTNKLDTLGQELQYKQRQLQDMMIVVEQQKSELADKRQQLEEKESLLTERETQLMEKKQEEEEDEEEEANTGNGNTVLKNNDHLTKEKGSISKATNSELEKNRSSFEGHHQMVPEDTQIQESQLEVEEREIYVEKNKELIEKNQMSRGIELKEKETVQDVPSYSNNLHKADAMLIDSKEQHKNFTENKQSGVEKSNPTEPETQEEESDKQHEEKEPQLGKTIREV